MVGGCEGDRVVGRGAYGILELYGARRTFSAGVCMQKTCQGSVLNLRNQVD